LKVIVALAGHSIDEFLDALRFLTILAQSNRVEDILLTSIFFLQLFHCTEKTITPPKILRCQSLTSTWCLSETPSGKTVLYHRIGERIFNPNTKATIGVEFVSRRFVIDEMPINVLIWDTAGQKRFWSIIRPYWLNANCIAVVYSVVDSDSFQRVSEIISDLRNDVCINSFIVLIGTRRNDSDRVIAREEAERKARGFGIPHFEMDAETNEGVEDGFEAIVKEGIWRRQSSRPLPEFVEMREKEREEPPESAEPPKKERKHLVGLFGSKKEDSGTTVKLRPPPSIPIQTPREKVKGRFGFFRAKKTDLGVDSDSDFDSDFDLEILP
jgi:GTPase SAR1 family protein